MATPVVLPRLGNTVESCLIVKWLRDIGDTISKGEPICEVETDKSVMEVESPASGTVLGLFFEIDSDVPVMTNIAAVGNQGEDISDLLPANGGAPEKNSDLILKEASTSPDPSQTQVPAVMLAPAVSAGSNGVSPRAKSLAARAGVNVNALNGTGPHGRVIERDVKAAAAAGARLSFSAREGVVGGEYIAPARGSGLGGMILREDLTKGNSACCKSAVSVGAKTEISVKGVRKVIAERMKQSLLTTAQLTLHSYAKAAALQDYRKAVKTHGEKYGLPDITINDMIVYAVSRVLPRHPQLNAHFLGDKIVQFSDVNIGIAVDTPRGLMVPVLKGVGSLGIGEISEAIKPLAKTCQAGNISPDLLQGGTFTITNLGASGIDHFTPVLNVPEVAILGVGGLSLRPYQGAQGVEFIPSLALSLTIDHQAVDGAPGARFLSDLVISIENFSLVLS